MERNAKAITDPTKGHTVVRFAMIHLMDFCNIVLSHDFSSKRFIMVKFAFDSDIVRLSREGLVTIMHDTAIIVFYVLNTEVVGEVTVPVCIIL